jgi:hypothetical protein
MALEDEYVRATQALIESLRARADALEKTLRETLSVQPAIPAGVVEEGKLLRKPAAWRAADHIERILERGKKTMKKDDLVRLMVEQQMVGGKDDNQREQYANEAIRRGVLFGYLKEDRSGTIHWVPGIRNSRVTKKL